MHARTPDPVRRALRAAGTPWLVAIVVCLVASCGKDGPTTPSTHAVIGHVVLRGYLVGQDGKFAGTKVVGDADGVRVELLFGDRVVAHATTVDGVYRFEGVGPGGYIVRAPVIDGLFYQTDVVTVAGTDLFVRDTLHVTSRGDIYPVPNPFGAATLGYFALPDTEHIEGRILDLGGNTVRLLITAVLAGGLQQMLWDGLDANGHGVTDTIYWMTLTEPDDARGQLIFREPGLPAPRVSAGVPLRYRALAQRSNGARVEPADNPPGRSAQLLR